MKKSYQRILILMILAVLLILYLLHSNLVVTGVLEYTNLFFTKLFPVSFLFFIFSSLFIDYGLIDLISTVLHLNGSVIYVTLMSMISGFPSGSKYVSDLLRQKLITEKTANYLILFTHFPNPLFILGPVGTIIKNNLLTRLILISIILANLTICIIFRPKEKDDLPKKTLKITNFAVSLSSAITSALKVLIIIYGSSLFFYLISLIISHYLTLSTYYYVIMNGIFDLTKGVFSTVLISDKIMQSIFIILFLSLGGISIHMQVKSILANTLVKYRNFFLGRILGTFLAISFFLIFVFIFKNN